MSKSNFLAYFKTLTKEEHKEFKAFVLDRQPKNDTATHLLNYFGKQHPLFPAKKFTKENLLDASEISGKIDKEQKLADTFTVLYRLIKDFLIYQQLESQSWEKEKLLANALAERNDYSIFTKHIQQVTQAIEAKMEDEEQITGAADFLALSELNGIFFFHPDTDKFKAELKALDYAMEYLEKYAVLVKFRYFIDYKLRLKVLAKQQKLSADDFISLAKGFPESIFQLYLGLFQLQDRHEEVTFLQMVEDLQKNLPKVSRLDKSFLIYKLLYHANTIYERGKIDYLHHIFNLFKIADESSIISYNNKITHTDFINAVSVASAAREFDWAEKFMDKYTSFLKEDLREETCILAQAYWYFFQKKYDETVKNIEELEYSHIGTRLLAETLRLRVYYELTIPGKEYQYRAELDTCAENLTRYLDREKEKNLSVERNQAIRNFTAVIKKMVFYFGDRDRTMQQKKKLNEAVKEEILDMKHIISRAWLLTKLKEWADNQRTS